LPTTQQDETRESRTEDGGSERIERYPSLKSFRTTDNEVSDSRIEDIGRELEGLEGGPQASVQKEVMH